METFSLLSDLCNVVYIYWGVCVSNLVVPSPFAPFFIYLWNIIYTSLQLPTAIFPPWHNMLDSVLRELSIPITYVVYIPCHISVCVPNFKLDRPVMGSYVDIYMWLFCIFRTPDVISVISLDLIHGKPTTYTMWPTNKDTLTFAIPLLPSTTVTAPTSSSPEPIASNDSQSTRGYPILFLSALFLPILALPYFVTRRQIRPLWRKIELVDKDIQRLRTDLDIAVSNLGPTTSELCHLKTAVDSTVREMTALRNRFSIHQVDLIASDKALKDLRFLLNSAKRSRFADLHFIYLIHFSSHGRD